MDIHESRARKFLIFCAKVGQCSGGITQLIVVESSPFVSIRSMLWWTFARVATRTGPMTITIMTIPRARRRSGTRSLLSSNFPKWIVLMFVLPSVRGYGSVGSRGSTTSVVLRTFFENKIRKTQTRWKCRIYPSLDGVLHIGNSHLREKFHPLLLE